MAKRILYVEEDKQVQDDFAAIFEPREYHVVAALTGVEALESIRKARDAFDLIVLDLVMPKMGGVEFLERLHEEGRAVPPVIGLSAHFDPPSISSCIRFGVRCLFRKPFEYASLVRVVSAIILQDHTALVSLVEDKASEIQAITNPEAETVLFKLSKDLTDQVNAKDPIGTMVKRRESALHQFFTDRSMDSANFQYSSDEPLFVVARRWNSWYPSVFDVPGGAYVVAGPRNRDGKGALALIDLGFRCLRVLTELGISVHDVEACVVSHNHPDHVAGIFELMASRHALGLRTKGWCNRTTKAMFGDCSGFGLEMDEMNDLINNVLFTYLGASGEDAKVCVRGFATAHREIGRISAPLGLCVSCCVQNPERERPKGKGIVLGDTEYNRQDHRHFVDILTDQMVNFVVLHVGSSQIKYREGGHLYYPGLKKILLDMDAALDAGGRPGGKLPVLVSEWGLEHATRAQISKICGRDLDGFDDRSPMVETTQSLNEEVDRMTVLPADIGLSIGLESGQIYLPDGTRVPAEDVEVSVTPDGLEYSGA